MITPDNPYFAQIRLLVAVLPIVATERCFALKGGTAINLFVRDMPRLSVDIDLAFVPISDRASALEEIDAALGRISETLAGRPYGYRVSVGKRQDSRVYGVACLGSCSKNQDRGVAGVARLGLFGVNETNHGSRRVGIWLYRGACCLVL